VRRRPARTCDQRTSTTTSTSRSRSRRRRETRKLWSSKPPLDPELWVSSRRPQRRAVTGRSPATPTGRYIVYVTISVRVRVFDSQPKDSGFDPQCLPKDSGFDPQCLQSTCSPPRARCLTPYTCCSSMAFIVIHFESLGINTQW